MESDALNKVRIDKWLWAARFYKTRSLAKQTIEGGKIRVDGERIKPSKEIERGALITLRQGWEEKEIEVLELSDQRRGAPEAQKLYRETEESLTRREQRAVERRTAGQNARTQTKPTTKERRQLQRVKREILGDDTLD